MGGRREGEERGVAGSEPGIVEESSEEETGMEKVINMWLKRGSKNMNMAIKL